MANTDRLINPRGRKHYRRSYSMTEVRIGLVILLGLGGFAGWVAYEGAHPRDDLFANTPDLLDPGSAPVERGPLPEHLAAKGWKEGRLAAFDADNLYEKINGRAGYFTSKGFVVLLFLPLTSEDTKGETIDVEVYDMGAAENALGAYVGEKPDEIASNESTGVVWHRDRNALYMARGSYYIRAIGSQESPGVDRALEHLRKVLETGLAAGERPWAHALLVDALGYDASTIEYAKENAMSFEFARNVYVAREGEDTELFVAPAPDPEAAEAMAKQYVQGFTSYGEVVEGGDWIKDQYLGAFSAVRTSGPLVIGVRGATTLELGEEALAKLEAAAAALPPEVLTAAQAAAAAPEQEEEPDEADRDALPEESYPPSEEPR
ncbi:MAG TPA: hypothetical protein ENK57_05100 [Polyangiaceae bacterium]|nr:hypothetical protein [Polyangiaceae bacterium]